MMKGILTGSFLFLAVCMVGQVTVTMTTSADTIMYGEVLEVEYVIEPKSGEEIEALDFSAWMSTPNLMYSVDPNVKDSIANIEIVDGGVFGISKSKLVVNKQNHSTAAIHQWGSIKVRINDVGFIVVPFPKVTHSSGDEIIEKGHSLVMIQGNGAGGNMNPQTERIHPDKSIIEEPVHWTDYLKYVLSFLGFLAFVYLLYKLISRSRKAEYDSSKEIEEKIVIPAHIKAYEALDALKEKELWQNGDTKGYHTELTRIMRQYIEDRYDVKALEMTSNQLKKELQGTGVKKDVIQRFDDILQIADKVKFAKGTTGPQINNRFMEEAYLIVDQTKESPTVSEQEE